MSKIVDFRHKIPWVVTEQFKLVRVRETFTEKTSTDLLWNSTLRILDPRSTYYVTSIEIITELKLCFLMSTDVKYETQSIQKAFLPMFNITHRFSATIFINKSQFAKPEIKYPSKNISQVFT